MTGNWVKPIPKSLSNKVNQEKDILELKIGAPYSQFKWGEREKTPTTTNPNKVRMIIYIL